MKPFPARVILLTTSSTTLRTFFVAQIRHLRSAGFRIHTISSPATAEVGAAKRLPMHAVTMVRRISPIADLQSLCRLCILLWRIRPALIQTHTPKAGLLGMMAARIAGIRVRIYTINGLVWIGRRGWRRKLLMATERLACALATDVIAVSPSIRQVAVELNVCPTEKIRVLGSGASHGVDPERFDPGAASADAASVRKRLGVPAGGLLLIYVGRLNREKGIEELAISWSELRDEFPNLHLLLCGTWEDKDPVAPSVVEVLAGSSRVHFATGSNADMPAYYAASDLCVLPTWREGLPNAALEAAAMRRAIVATRIPGCVDAVQDGVTGLLVEPRDARALTSALRLLLSDEPTRRRMGENGRQFVLEHFHENSVSMRLISEYRRLIANIDGGQVKTGGGP